MQLFSLKEPYDYHYDLNAPLDLTLRFYCISGPFAFINTFTETKYIQSTKTKQKSRLRFVSLLPLRLTNLLLAVIGLSVFYVCCFYVLEMSERGLKNKQREAYLGSVAGLAISTETG